MPHGSDVSFRQRRRLSQPAEQADLLCERFDALVENNAGVSFANEPVNNRRDFAEEIGIGLCGRENATGKVGDALWTKIFAQISSGKRFERDYE